MGLEVADYSDGDDLTRSVQELGDPEAIFRVGRGRFATKLCVGILLVVVGAILNYLWWVEGPGGFNHIVHIMLFGIPFCGVYLLWHMYRNRGLVILIYPTGLLRLCRGEVDSFPWSEIAHVAVLSTRTGAGQVFASKAEQKAANVAVLVRDPDGSLVACWLPVKSPMFKLWNSGLCVTRADGTQAHFSAALTDYERLAEEIQRRTFQVLWPRMWEQFLSGEPIAFGDIELSHRGLRFNGKLIRWADLKEVTIIQNMVGIKQQGKWFTSNLVNLYSIPNPHVLFAMVREAQRVAVR